MTILHVLAIYGLCFGFMNKTPDVFRKVKFIDMLLSCSYCTGFHCGWLVYAVHTTQTHVYSGPQFLLWALAGSAVCYVLDTITIAASRSDNVYDK